MPPINILIKPASGNCNMRCTYCFYADEQEHRSVSSHGIMSKNTMHRIIDKAMEYGDGVCTLAFQGGEPTLAGLDFYEDLAEYAAHVPNPKKIRFQYAIQTNGYNIDEQWARFWAKNRYLVGISLDGPKEIHDRYRKDASGQGTYNKIMVSIRLLEKYRVDYNVLTVVTAATARSGQKIYNFYKKNKIHYQQYIECLDPLGEMPGGQEYSLTPKRYETFLKSLFDAWYLDVKADKPVYNRYFDNLLMIMDRQVPESCNMRGVCGKQWVIEADGSVYRIRNLGQPPAGKVQSAGLFCGSTCDLKALLFGKRLQCCLLRCQRTSVRVRDPAINPGPFMLHSDALLVNQVSAFPVHPGNSRRFQTDHQEKQGLLSKPPP